MHISHEDLQACPGAPSRDAQKRAEHAAADEEATIMYRRMLEDEEARAQRAALACACCGRACLADAPPGHSPGQALCLAWTLLAEKEDDASERWNYPEQHHAHD